MKTSEELLNGKSKSMRTILLIEADKKHARKFKEIIEPLDLACTHVTNFDDRKQIFSHTPFICLVDVINNKKKQVKDFIHRYRVTNPYAVCIVTAEAEQQTQVLEYLDLGVYDYLLKPFDPLTVNKVLEHCLERITVQIDNNRLQNQLYEVRNEAGLFSDMLSMVFNAAKRFISCDYLDELGGVIMNEFSNIFNIMGGSLFVLENEKLQRLYSLDPGHTPEEIRLPLEGSSIFGQVMQRKEPLLFKDFNEEQQYSSSGWKGYKNESFLVLPLIHNTHHFVGCVSLHNKENNGFTADDKKIGGVLSGLSASVIHAVKNIEKLRESEEKYRYFFEENPAADFIVTPQGKITLCNPSFTSIIGPTRNNDGIEYELPDLYGDKKEWERVVEIIKDKKKVESYETEFTRHDGSSVNVIGNYHGRFNELGDLLDIKGVIIDVTQRKRLEEQLNHSMKMEAVGRFAGSIAHDFNNLVTAILGYSDLCLRVLNENDSLYTDISEIKHAATMAAELTRKLLYFSKKQKTKSEKINLNRILGEMDGMLRRLLGEEVEFTTFFDPALCPIKADPGQIEQVIMNLAVNARDAMPNGGKLIIQTELITVADADEKRDIGLLPGRYAVLSIMDTGLGMDAETRSHIFEPFFSTKPKDKGTGLGLSTVYAIMEKNGGIIEVESAKTRGTIFKCYFPSITQKTKKSIRTASETPVRHATILLVEDKEIVRSMVERVLFGEGYAVVKARNAEQALIMFARKRLAVDMLITDVNLPEISGYELAEKLKKIYPDLRIIFASGNPEKSEKQKERETRDNIDFIEKPFTGEQLLRKVNRLLSKKTT